MNPFLFVYHEFLFRPLLNLLVWIADFVPGHEVGWAIIGVTVVVRLILLPSSLHQARQMQSNQKKMAEVKGALDGVKEKYKDDKAKQAEETMKIYRKAGINPASGCLPLLIQLPILIALYRVFLVGLTPETFDLLYGFVSRPEFIDNIFFGINLGEPSFVLAIIAGAGQFIQTRMMASQALSAQPAEGDDMAQMMASMQKNMMYIFPAMTVFIALQLPAALPLYWAVSTIFGIGQQYFLKRTMHLSAAPPSM